MSEPILKVEDLVKRFPLGTSLFSRGSSEAVRAVDGISFEVRPREVLGIVGESGCGKSTAGRAALRLIEPTSGRIYFAGEEITKLPRARLRSFRQRFQFIFQDPFSSLNPRMRINRIVGEPLTIHRLANGAEQRERVAAILGKVGLSPEFMNRYPHELSGGQRQRVGIARALVVEPELIIADEPVSALDVSIQAQVLNLLADLRDEFELSIVMVSHDMSVIQHACDRIAVMYLGKLVEVANADDVVMSPRHPYTRALLSAVPSPDPGKRKARSRIILEGDVPNPVNPPPGCAFHTRCPHRIARCAEETPAMREVAPGRFAACHLSEQIFADA